MRVPSRPIPVVPLGRERHASPTDGAGTFQDALDGASRTATRVRHAARISGRLRTLSDDRYLPLPPDLGCVAAPPLQLQLLHHDRLGDAPVVDALEPGEDEDSIDGVRARADSSAEGMPDATGTAGTTPVVAASAGTVVAAAADAARPNAGQHVVEVRPDPTATTATAAAPAPARPAAGRPAAGRQVVEGSPGPRSGTTDAATNRAAPVTAAAPAAEAVAPVIVTTTVNPPLTSGVNMPVTTSDSAPVTASGNEAGNPTLTSASASTSTARGSSPLIGLASLLESTAPPVAAPRASPLEDAVQDLLRDLEAQSAAAGAPDGTPVAVDTSRAASSAPVLAAVPVAAPARAERPELPTPTSHMHLVLDEGEERVVVTVAVRGQDVRVSLRGSDDTTAALARNAASLDHGLRQRGLDLAHLDLQRESPRDRERPAPEREQEQPTADATPFTLDEAP